MLISPPFLPTRTANESDAAWVNRAMSGSADGTYPISYHLGWHGGVHIEAPSANSPVLAIADGTVVGMRTPSTKNDHALHPLNYGSGWTSDGYVMLKHETEIGSGANGKVTFYSMIMHLHSIRPTVKVGKKVYRKDELGQAGYIQGQPNKIHIEIICDDANLEKLVGRSSNNFRTGADGRTDAVYGEVYFQLPAGTAIYQDKPADNIITPTAQAKHTTAKLYYVGLRYHCGEQPNPGGATLSTYQEDGTVIANGTLTENTSEYDLYKTATRISESYSKAQEKATKLAEKMPDTSAAEKAKKQQALQAAKAMLVPAPSAVYELLRFGRVINTANETLNPADTPHWRQIKYEGGTGWVNLNQSTIKRFSDADFPTWKHWQLIDDDTNGDSRCDSPLLKQWLDVNKDGKINAREAAKITSIASVRTKLNHAICKLPTEWAKSTIEKRYGWLKQSSNTHAKLSDKDFKRLAGHIHALAFWEDANTGLSKTHWHFEPRAFITHFRQCGWLSEEELTRIYTHPSFSLSRRKVQEITHAIGQNILALNLMMSKYLIVNGIRKSHFLGQGAMESNFLTSMQEVSQKGSIQNNKWIGIRGITPASELLETNHWYGKLSSEDDPFYRLAKYNSRGIRFGRSYSWWNGNVGDVDAQKFRGRGFKQLTGRSNYAGYWVYRGWISRSSFDSNWWSDPAFISHNEAQMQKKPAVIDSPQIIANNPYNCMDSGGWYMTFERPRVISNIDKDSWKIATTQHETTYERNLSKKVTKAINGGDNGWASRLKYTRGAKEILL